MRVLIKTLVVMLVLSDLFWEMGPRSNSMEAIPQGLDQRSKMAEVVTKMVRREARMWHNPEGGNLDPADDVHRCCKKNSLVLSCIYKRTKESCDHGSEVQAVHSKRDGKNQFL